MPPAHQTGLAPAVGIPRLDLTRIEAAALQVLADMGIACRLESDVAACCRAAGMVVNSDRLIIPKGVALKLLALAPRSFTHVARNPVHSLEISPALSTFGPVQEPRNVWNGVQRASMRAHDAAMIGAIAEASPLLGYGASALHLLATDATASERLVGFTLSSERPLLASARAPFSADTLIAAALAATQAAPTPDGPHCRLLLIAAVDSALTFDPAFIDAVMALSAAEEGVIIAPTLLIGANAPATRDGLLVRFAAETLAGAALTQALCPGLPVALGATISDISLRNGLPLAGTADAMAALGACIELTRHWGLAFFALGPATAVKGFDALGTAESARWLTAAHALGANAIVGAIGAVDLDDGVSMEKLIVDLAVAAHIRLPFGNGSDDPIAELAAQGHGGTALASAPTQVRARTMQTGMLDDNQLYESWVAAGAPTLQQRLEPLIACAQPTVAASVEDHAAVLSAVEDAEPRTIDNPGLADGASGIYSRALRDALGFKG